MLRSNQDFERLFDRYAQRLALGALFWIPLKLFLAYIFIVPLVVLWLLKSWRTLDRTISMTKAISAPFIFFVLSLTINSMFGIDAWRSLREIPSLLFFALLVFAVMDTASKSNPLPFLYALAAGQGVAASHSVLEAAFPRLVLPLFLGKVTESGQLALMVLAIAGVAAYLNRSSACPTAERDDRRGPAVLHNSLFWPALGLINLVSFLCLAFHLELSIDFAVMTAIGIISAAGTIISCLGVSGFLRNRSKTVSSDGPYWHGLITSFILPLLVAALVINLKRGPWAGVLTGLSIFLFIYERRLLLPVLLLALFSLFYIKPVHERLLESPHDFFISGGRSTIWDIGGELSTRFPLGIGYKNSAFLQKFSPEIPRELDHFHNNYLNILVETGWITLGLFLWWVCSLVCFAFRSKAAGAVRLVSYGIGCSIFSWQIAGLVEYNFGDAEVMLVVYALIGILLALNSPSPVPTQTQK